MATLLKTLMSSIRTEIIVASKNIVEMFEEEVRSEKCGII